MALPIRTLRLPLAAVSVPSVSTTGCPSCLRTTGFAFQQVRGKKKLSARQQGIVVRLLKDIPTFGRAGTVMSVARGRMRNIWYPKQMAEYIMAAELKKIPQSEIMQKDASFMADTLQPIKIEEKKVEIKLLTARETYETLETTLPPVFTFSAKAIVPGQKAIHGSIGAAQVAGAIRSILAAQQDNENASRVVVKEDSIQVYGSPDDPTKIKDLGDFTFSLHLDDHTVVRRKISVIEQDAE